MIRTRLLLCSLLSFLWMFLKAADSNVHTFRCSVLNDDESNQALCSFVVEQEPSSPSASAQSSSLSASSTITTSMEHCLEDYCVQVTVQTVPKRPSSTTSTSSSSPSTTQSSSSSSTSTAPSLPPSASPTKSTASSGELHTLSVRPTARGIQIGDVTYQRPFSQYGEEVNQALEGLLEALSSSSSAAVDMTEQLQEQAFWLVELGLAHRMFVAPTVPTAPNPSDGANPNLDQSLNALHQAHTLYDQLRQHHRVQRGASSSSTIAASSRVASAEQQLWIQETDVSLANVHFHLGESYLLHPKLYQRTLGHYRESERLFRVLSQQGDDAIKSRKNTNSRQRSLLSYDEADIDFNWAEACLQLASFILNQGTVDDPDLVLSDVVDTEAAESARTTAAASKIGTTQKTTTTRRTSRTTNSGEGMLFAQQQAYGQQQLVRLNELFKNAKEASGLLENAVAIYRSQLDDYSSISDSTTSPKKSRSKRSRFQMSLDDEEQEQEMANVYRMKLATALQHSSTALTFLSSSLSSKPSAAAGSSSSSKSLLEQALEQQDESFGLFRQVLTHVERKLKLYGDADVENTLVANDLVFSIANSLYGLSDLHLQLGQYDPAQKRYEETMEWYRQHANELPLPPLAESTVMGTEGDGTLEAYEQALEQYHDQMNDASEQRLGKEDSRHDVGGGKSKNPYGDEDGPLDGDGSPSWILESSGDQTYEGDLHATLGSLRMARGDVALAIGHFDQAVRLYRASAFLSGDEEERSVADVHFNWAMALLRAGEYKESAVVHGKALEGYRKSVGEGNNPLAALNGMLSEADADVLEGLEENVADSTSVSAVGKDGNVVDAKESKDASGASPSVPLIDLNLFQSSLLNATTGDEL